MKFAKIASVDETSISVDLTYGEKELERAIASEISGKSRTGGFLENF